MPCSVDPYTLGVLNSIWKRQDKTRLKMMTCGYNHWNYLVGITDKSLLCFVFGISARVHM